MPLKLNVGDSWKSLSSIKINISDTWKTAERALINIGDSWKQFYYRLFIPTSSTRLYYKLENNVTDSSGNGYNGTASNITYTTALIPTSSYSASFLSGSTSTITGPNNTEFGYSGDFTVSVWIKPMGVASSYRGVVSRRLQNDSIGWTCGMYQTAVGRYSLIFSTAGGGSYYEIWSSDGGANYIPILTGTTYLATYVRTSATLQIYVNGLLNRQQTYGSILDCSTAATLYIGRTRQSAGEQYNGYMDDIIVENRAWSANEILTYYTGNKFYTS